MQTLSVLLLRKMYLWWNFLKDLSILIRFVIHVCKIAKSISHAFCVDTAFRFYKCVCFRFHSTIGKIIAPSRPIKPSYNRCPNIPLRSSSTAPTWTANNRVNYDNQILFFSPSYNATFLSVWRNVRPSLCYKDRIMLPVICFRYNISINCVPFFHL
jgi:hypothetical protein